MAVCFRSAVSSRCVLYQVKKVKFKLGVLWKTDASSLLQRLALLHQAAARDFSSAAVDRWIEQYSDIKDQNPTYKYQQWNINIFEVHDSFFDQLCLGYMGTYSSHYGDCLCGEESWVTDFIVDNTVKYLLFIITWKWRLKAKKEEKNKPQGDYVAVICDVTEYRFTHILQRFATSVV